MAAPKTVLTYPLNGAQRDFPIPFEYLARKFVVVTLVGSTRKTLTLNSDYRFTSRTTVTTTKAWGPGDQFATVELRRITSATERLVDFADGSILRAYDLNTAQVQSLHIAEEARDLTADTIGVNNDGDLDARGRKIVNVADGVLDGDAVSLGQNRRWAESALSQADRAKVQADAAKAAASASQVSNSESMGWANQSKTFAANSQVSNSESMGWANQSKTFSVNSQVSNSESMGWANQSKSSAVTSQQWTVESSNNANRSQASAASSETSRLAAAVAESNAKAWAASVNMPTASGNAGRYLRQNDAQTGIQYGRHETEIAFGTRFSESIAAGGTQRSIFSVLAANLSGVYTAFIKGTSNGIVVAAQLNIVATHPGRLKISCMNSGFAQINWKATVDNQGNSTIFLGLPGALTVTPIEITVLHMGTGADTVRPGTNSVGSGGTEIPWITGPFQSWANGTHLFAGGVNTQSEAVTASLLKSTGNVEAGGELRGSVVRTNSAVSTTPTDAPNAPKAMVVFSGAGAVLKQFGVSSVGRLGAGLYRITWQTPRKDSDYHVDVSSYGQAISGVSYGGGCMTVNAQTPEFVEIIYAVTGSSSTGAAGNSRVDPPKLYLAMYDY